MAALNWAGGALEQVAFFPFSEKIARKWFLFEKLALEPVRISWGWVYGSSFEAPIK